MNAARFAWNRPMARHLVVFELFREVRRQLRADLFGLGLVYRVFEQVIGERLAAAQRVGEQRGVRFGLIPLVAAEQGLRLVVGNILRASGVVTGDDQACLELAPTL